MSYAMPQTERPINPPGPAAAFEVENAVCPRCDAPLWFDPTGKELFCPTCTRFPIVVIPSASNGGSTS